MFKDKLLAKIDDRSACIGIVGLGYVGLPLAVAFAQVGFNVVGLEVNPEKVQILKTGKSYIPDIPSNQLLPLVESGKLCATTNFLDLASADIISICVPTPLDANRTPDLSFITNAVDAIIKASHPGMLLVLESTTYPGTTEEILSERLQRNGFTIGSDVFVAFSPERIDPSNPKYNVFNTPKVVGGATPDCQEVACAYYGSIVERIVPVSSPAVAEMVKIVENTFRAVNIGLVNELAMICDLLNIDCWEVIDAAASKPFGFTPFYPGPGVGGHCIPIDPLYLSWKLKSVNFATRFIDLADKINSAMPRYVVEKVVESLNDEMKAVRCAKIAVIGVAYKRDVNDIRESPALEIIKALSQKGALIEYHDPYVPYICLDKAQINSVPLTPQWLSAADCVLIITDHSNLDWATVTAHSRLIMDTRNVTSKVPIGNGKVVKL